ncbi:MAG: mechanosensitive ion channel protein [Betaproteobacteria bacterium]|jgi:small-conductance mechanosensitive channel|nr:mechanosensitive ion channel protein [Betaproteobacteria bacterium]NBZ98395.1 mechanosensitive ion channel protein [Betaproteobacteria bacterium]NDB43406.1 mechanosensitive ion channel protein [Betaproteobacteria bacterium]NDD00523.1 mechanosensitive ion channel protein [Betaproteobacteria bacterium]NDE23417.1 mechanosensitive ion channel protein [Betaproteobacteria bacterium]
MMNDPQLWWSRLNSVEALQELLLFAACVGVALALAWALRRITLQWELKVLLGDQLVDGVLFPSLLLGLVFASRSVWAKTHALWLFDFLLPVCISLAAIRLGVKVLQAAFKEAAWVRPVERSLSWLAWAAVVLWLTGLLPMVLEELDQIQWKVGTSHLSVRTLIEGGLTAGLVMLLTLWMSSAIESRLLRTSTGSELSLRKAVSNAVTSLLMFVGLMVSLSAVGIDLTALSVLGGAVGVGIGFGLQKLAANYVSGFVILAERSMRIGDSVKVDGFEGRVTDIKARYTVIRAPTGRESIVPNEMLINNRVENLSLADSKVLQSTSVLVAYGSDVDLVMQLLTQACDMQMRVLQEPATFVTLTSFAADGLEFSAHYWVDEQQPGLLTLKSEINLSILKLLNEHGIEIPYPQRVVHSRAG